MDDAQFVKNGHHNRNRIKGVNGYIWLTVPVQSKGLHHQKICDVQIDNSQDWAKIHWNSIMHWYGRAPFFREHSDFFQDVYAREWYKLIDLNICILRYLLNALNIRTPVYFESEIGTSAKSTDRIIGASRIKISYTINHFIQRVMRVAKNDYFNFIIFIKSCHHLNFATISVFSITY